MKFFISSKKIGLRPVETNDLENIAGWLNDPEVTHFMFYGRLPSNKEQIKKLFEYDTNSDNNVAFIIIDKETSSTIGFAGIFEIDSISRIGEIRILIGEKKFWNEEYGMEVCAVLTHYGFDRLNLNMIYLGASRKDNRGAIKFFEFLGYKLVGIRRQLLYRNGRYYDGMIMDILRSEYYPKIMEFYREKFGLEQ